MLKRYPYQIVLTILFLVIGMFQSPSFADSSKSVSQEIIDTVYKDNELSHFTIEVSDSAYSVIIRGEVATNKQKQEIIRIATSIAGSRQIEDQIKVSSEKFGNIDTSDSEITAKIQDAISNENLTGSTFKVNDGVVTVTGNFKTFRDVDYLFSLIQSVPGVKRVVSNAVVNSKPYMKEFEGRGKDYNDHVQRK